MQTKASLYQDLCDLNNLFASHRVLVPESKRSSISKLGFTFRLPPRRNTPGTDELLARAQQTHTLGRTRTSKAFTEAYYWDNLDYYCPAHADIDDELPDPGESEKRSKGMNNRTYHCGVGDFAMMGHAEFELVLSASVQRFQQEKIGTSKRCAARILTMIACMCPFDAVRLLKPHPTEDAILREPPPRSAVSTLANPNPLHHTTTETITFYVPRVVQEALKFLHATPDQDVPDAADTNAFLRTITPFVTVAGIQSYLLYTGFERWGYSPVVPMSSFRGIGSRPGVFASYVRADTLFRSMMELHEFIDPSYKAPSTPVANGYGCDHVPKDEEVRAYYLAWRQSCQPPHDPSDEAVVAWHNGFVAGLHQFACILCGGTRNYPGSPPDHARVPGSFIINHEKDHFVPTMWSQCLRDGIVVYDTVKAVVQKQLTAAGRLVIWPGGDAYAFLSIEEAGECRFHEVSATTTAAALEDYPPLSRWADFHLNALRAFAMSKLYESMRFHTHDIEGFFGRAKASLAPLRKHRLEDTSMKTMRALIETELMSSLQ